MRPLNIRVWPAVTFLSIVILIVLFCLFRGPSIQGDTSSYLEAVTVLDGAPAPESFIPNRLLTTFLGLEIIRFLSPVFGGVLPAWFFLNVTLFVLSCVLFFKLLARLFNSEKTAFVGTLFLAANYGFFLFGLNYLMDIGGWSFYIFSLYFVYRYIETKSPRHIMLSALMVRIGGLFKEYAFFWAIAIAVAIIIENRHSIKEIVVRGTQTALIALVPVGILYLYIYSRFGYTYLDWFGFNSGYYVYVSRIIEYIKTFGSLVNFLAFIAIGGAIIVVREWRSIDVGVKTFIFAVLASFLPIFLWPAITQRIMSITVPFIVLIACFMVKRFESRWYYFLPLLALYALATFFMDSTILDAVNLPF